MVVGEVLGKDKYGDHAVLLHQSMGHLPHSVQSARQLKHGDYSKERRGKHGKHTSRGGDHQFCNFFLISPFPESFHFRQKENKAFVFERYLFSRLQKKHQNDLYSPHHL